jgi:hypothetical protein
LQIFYYIKWLYSPSDGIVIAFGEKRGEEVTSHGNSFRIPLKIGAVCGPIFGVFDMTGIDSNICNNHFLQMIPVGLIELSQVLVLMHPDQVKNHRCSGERCAFSRVDCSRMPNADFICWAWFPNEENEVTDWKEASISIGGAMVAAKHLQSKLNRKNASWNFAFWCETTETWDILEVFIDQDEYAYAIVYRRDFTPPDLVYTLAQNTVASLGLEDEAETFLQILKASFRHLSNIEGPHFALTVFVDRYKNVNERKNLGANPQFVPFLPIFAGELHNVVPVGNFLRTFLLFDNPSMKHLKPYMGLLELLRDMPDRYEVQEKVLDYFGLSPHWKRKEIFRDYPLQDATCGWTFFGDTPPGELLSLLPIKFLSIEPGTPIGPPFGNSASGALTCAVARSILYPGEEPGRTNYRGKTYQGKKPWGERFYGYLGATEGKYLVIQKNENGLWVIKAPVHEVGQFMDAW